jgi:hypothetical protein
MTSFATSALGEFRSVEIQVSTSGERTYARASRRRVIHSGASARARGPRGTAPFMGAPSKVGPAVDNPRTVPQPEATHRFC